MTREQAIATLVAELYGPKCDPSWAGRWVRALEALGLLKLEEPAPVLHVPVCPQANAGLSVPEQVWLQYAPPMR
jgi:hypothetical protein